MITNDLIEYINGELNDNVSKDLIISTLLEAGWHKEDIEEGFSSIKEKDNQEVKKSFDPYRELPEEGDPMTLKLKAEIEEKNTGTVNIPVKGDISIELPNKSILNIPIIDTAILNKPIVIEEPVVEKPVVKEPIVEITPVETPVVAFTMPVINTTILSKPIVVEEKVVEKPVEKELVVETTPVEKPVAAFTMPVINIPVINTANREKVEANKIWVPTTIKPASSNSNETGVVGDNIKEEKKEDSRKLEISNLEISNNKEQVVGSEIKLPEIPVASIVATPIQDIPKIESLSKIEPSIVAPTVPAQQIEKKEIVKEFIPVINKAPTIASMGGMINKPEGLTSTKPASSLNSMSDIVQNKAMISSYSQDIVSATKKQEEIAVVGSSHKKKLMLKLGLFLVALTLIGGMVFAFVAGYIKIPGSKFNFSVVKKDPKNTILNGSLAISKLKSFKTQTNINISSPSFSSITTGLSSGEVVNTKDTDSISIDAKGLVNNINNKSVFDYIFDVKSSVWDKGFTTDLKYNNGDLLFSVPDLTPILGKSAPDTVTVSASRDQLGLIVKELPIETQDLVKKLDIYNIISMEVPLYVKNEIGGIMNEFINTFEYVSKGEEAIHGVDTTHYEVTVTRASTKKFLSGLSNLFLPQLSPDEKKNLDEAIGASSISSFDVWIGKDDDNIYQFKFTLNAPLSKVLSLNDSGIAGNEVKLDWTTTFYDLDVENKIVIPSGEVNMDGFIKNIQNIKIKNTINSFKSQTSLFKNAVGSYGKNNTLGSCIAPILGSMFSPLGHSKGADTAVSSISNIMNSLLAVTKNEGSCYSTPKAWALSAPLNTTPVSFYCVDSEGNTTTLLSSIAGPVCSGSTSVVETPKNDLAVPKTEVVSPKNN